jgi:mono/diheme cytochrome c family protein
MGILMRALVPPGGVLLLLAACASPAPTAERPPSAEDARFFEAQVRPILQARCVTCHGREKARSGLRLGDRDALLKGGRRGPAVSLDKPDESLLLQAVNHQDLKMPPGGKLPPEQIDILARWVRKGAPWPEGVALIEPHGPPPVDEQARGFWSFRPVSRPPVPAIRDAGWVRTPIDAFVLARLEAAGLRPAPPAGKTSLLRRLYFDLVGLPPSPEEVDAFLADDAPDAYERVVERLLASPHYGERWARHWLDLVRFAETNSFEVDGPKPNAWRYRDYVIKSFNDDKPYDRFIKEQLAGDEVEPLTADGLVATGYYRLGPWDPGAPDRLQATFDELDDVVATTGQAFLGLTVNCARCHDHKNDPFPQKDYYRLLAFFRGVQRYGPRGSQRALPVAEGQAGPSAEVVAYQKKLAAVAAEMKAVEDALEPQLTGGERDDFVIPQNRPDILRKHVPEHVSQETLDRYQSLAAERTGLERRRPAGLAQALSVSEGGPTPPDTFVLLRGSPRAPGDRVEPGFPSVLATRAAVLPAPAAGARTSGRRRVLAEWLASPDNPLTARVMANRLWQHHFGRGIVRSANDFGYRGTPPTHPELLDWLATEFVARGWSVKAMHRLIVTSSAYRVSSRPEPAALARDPDNDLFGRRDLRRLSAEEVRDAILAVCGNLNATHMGGPGVYPRLSAEVFAGQSRPGDGWGRSPPEEQARRSVYVHVKRSLLLPLLAAFDAADTDFSCPVRFTTTVPTQALGMLNGDFVNEQAGVLAADLRRRAGDDPAAQVRLALRRVAQREPSAGEVGRGVALLARLRDRHGLTPDEALRDFCLLALNLNEFVYLD